MEEAIILLEKEIKEIQLLISSNMNKVGDYPSKLEHLIGAYYLAIDKLKA